MTHPSAEQTPSFSDFAAFPSPYLKAMLKRLRVEMFSVARALRGELLDAFWDSIDELNDLRRAEATSTPWQRSSVPQLLVVLEGGELQKALLMRLRIDMFSVARSMTGELHDAFWQSVDELAALRPKRRLVPSA